MKVIIVGAGISGLCTYLFLQKYCKDKVPLDIIIYESYDPAKKLGIANFTFNELSASATAIVGGGIGLMPNGLRVLSALDEKVHDKARDGGFVCQNFEFRSARGWHLGNSSCGDMRGKPGWPPGKEEFCVSMSRHNLWNTLKAEVDPKKIVYKKVVSVQKAIPSEDKKASVTFEDGQVEEADLIIGADGVRSKVREAIFGGDGDTDAVYEGLLGVGGFIEGYVPESVRKDKTMVFEFGSNGFFGYGAINENTAMWWSTCQEENVPQERKITPEEMKEQLRKRHGHWKDPAIQECIEKSTVSQIYPTWVTPDLPTWSAEGLVIIGDAAHALHPTSGQGASMSLEDCQCFALALSKYLEAHVKEGSNLSLNDAVALSSKTFYDLRSGRIKKVSDRAKMMAGSKKDLPFAVEMIMCGMMWFITKFPAIGILMLGNVPHELFYEWDCEKAVPAEVEKHLSLIDDIKKVRAAGF